MLPNCETEFNDKVHYVSKYVRTQESSLDMSTLFSMCPAPVWTHVHCFNMQFAAEQSV